MGSRGASSGRRLNEVGVRKLEKSNRTLLKVIEQHRDYIRNPKQKYADWDTLNEKQKQGAINHWQQEIDAMNKTISRNQRRMEEYRDARRRK